MHRRCVLDDAAAYALTVTSLLLVEDDERISQPLVRMLQAEGFDVTHVDRCAAVGPAVAAATPDLVLLDLSLPDGDGLDVCRQLRHDHPALPIVMLTARSDEVDIVVGLGAGADDYVAKPFRVGELVARIRARLRMAAVAALDGAASDPDLSIVPAVGLGIDLAARRVHLDGSEVMLAPKEFDLLVHLAAHPGVTLRREDIMSSVWDEHWWGSTRTLDTHVAALRRKLRDTVEPARFITTIRGVGLRFESA